MQFREEGIMLIKFGSRVQETFKDISILSSGGHYVWQDRTICAIWIMGNIHLKLFYIRNLGPVVKLMLFNPLPHKAIFRS